jgi:hypothetical protein
MSAKHTPGDWLVAYNRNTGRAKLEVLGRNGQICVAAELGDGPEAEANAKLIAAAPKLLKALNAIIKTCNAGVIIRYETEKPQWSALDHIESVARGAIAKAVGEKP